MNFIPIFLNRAMMNLTPNPKNRQDPIHQMSKKTCDNPKLYLPSERKSKKAGEKTAGDPTKHAKQGSQGASFWFQTDVENRIDDGQQEAKIQKQRKTASQNGKLQRRKIEK